MNKHKGMTRGFSHLSKAWYGSVCLKATKEIDSITMGFYDVDDGGTTGDFSIAWEWQGNNQVPCLRSYDDSWDALVNFSDVLAKLAEVDDQNASPDDIALLLISCGVKDMTRTTFDS